MKPELLQQVAQDIFSLVNEDSFQVPIAKIFALEEMKRLMNLWKVVSTKEKYLLKYKAQKDDTHIWSVIFVDQQSSSVSFS